MPEARDVVLARHGETEWSATGRHTGRTDVPLTERGRAQARELGRLLAGRTFALALTSPLSRASETCRQAGFECAPDDDLREWDYGAHEGRTTPEIREDDPGWTIWRGPVPDGETIEEVSARADRVIARIEAVDGDIVVFSHGHFLRVLAARWLDLPPATGAGFILGTGTLSILSTERDARALRLWNGYPPASSS